MRLCVHRRPNSAGDGRMGFCPVLAGRGKASGLLIAVGPRLDERTTGGYTLIDVPRPKQKFVHVHPGAEELGRVYEADLPINTDMPELAAMARALKPVDRSAWKEWTRAARKEYEAWHEPGTAPGALDFGRVMTWLRKRLPPETIVTNGAGNFAG